ncbi:hypothetical protein DFP73DRAFT_528158 [Morchella snyderi]|nr:hypothetical protein DFP73DRAFT_528158 [Morchella snyderi]
MLIFRGVCCVFLCTRFLPALRTMIWAPVKADIELVFGTAAVGSILDMDNEIYDCKDTTTHRISITRASNIITIADRVIMVMAPRFIDITIDVYYLYRQSPLLAVATATHLLFYLCVFQGLQRKDSNVWQLETEVSLSLPTSLIYEMGLHRGKISKAQVNLMTMNWDLVSLRRAIVLMGKTHQERLSHVKVLYDSNREEVAKNATATWFCFEQLNSSVLSFVDAYVIGSKKRTKLNDKDLVDLVLGEGKITLNNVTFHHKDPKTLVFKNLSFTIPGGTRVAIVGESGVDRFRIGSRFFPKRSIAENIGYRLSDLANEVVNKAWSTRFSTGEIQRLEGFSQCRVSY